MEDGVVLNGAVFANYNVTVIGPNHGTGPDAGTFSDGHVTYYVSGFTYEGGWMYARGFPI